MNIIHENHAYISVTPNYILQLHRELLKHTAFSYGGKFKTAPNEIAKTLSDGTKEIVFTPLEPYETPDAVASLCETYQKSIGKGIIDPLILIPCFVLDFLCIHPFNDGNGRMSRLLTLLLLYKCGYMVGQFISIEKAIADTKESYYDALALSRSPVPHGMRMKMIQRHLSNTCWASFSLVIENLKTELDLHGRPVQKAPLTTL